MSKTILFRAFFALMLHTQISAQSIFSIKEETSGLDKKEKILSGQSDIIDINSRLNIALDKNLIRTRALEISGNKAEIAALDAKLKELDELLAYHETIANDIQNNPRRPTRQMLKTLSAYLDKVQSKPEYADIFEKVAEEVGYDPSRNIYLASLERFSEEMLRVQSEINALQEGANLRFSLMAFRLDKAGGGRVHIENFDRLEEGAIMEVERWVTTFSPEQVAKMRDLKKRAKDLHEQTDEILAAYKAQIRATFPALDCVPTLKGKIQTASQTLPDAVKVKLKDIEEDNLAKLDLLLRGIKSDAMSGRPNLQGTVKNRIEQFRLELAETLKALETNFKTELTTNADLLDVKNCVLQAKTDVDSLYKFIELFPQKYFEKVNLETEEISEEIFDFKLEDIPNEGLVNLKTSGRRVSGDEFMLKAVIRYPKDSLGNDSKPPITLEKRYFTMYLTGMHSTTKVGLVITKPIDFEIPNSEKQFRFAPAASLLLKKGSRNSHFYNRFLDFGFGVNTTMPDFTNDGEPEFSAGIIITALKDVVSFGYDYNFTIKKPFWFLGVHLPFNLPGVPMQQNSSSENVMGEGF